QPGIAIVCWPHSSLDTSERRLFRKTSWPTKAVRDTRYRPPLATPKKDQGPNRGQKGNSFRPDSPHRSAPLRNFDSSTRKQTRPTSPTSLLHRLSAPALLSRTHSLSSLAHAHTRDTYSSFPSAAPSLANTLRGPPDHHRGGKY
ncbi:hypothetical protein CORC01_12526, partial [Colletotrichum orchidophilum]